MTAPGAWRNVFGRSFSGQRLLLRNTLSTCEADCQIPHATVRTLTLISGSGCLLQPCRTRTNCAMHACSKHPRIGAIAFSESPIVDAPSPLVPAAAATLLAAIRPQLPVRKSARARVRSADSEVPAHWTRQDFNI